LFLNIKKEARMFEKLIGRKVAVGVPNRNEPDHLYFYYGILEAVDDKILELLTKHGIVYITLDRIKSVEEVV